MLFCRSGGWVEADVVMGWGASEQQGMPERVRCIGTGWVVLLKGGGLHGL